MTVEFDPTQAIENLALSPEYHELTSLQRDNFFRQLGETIDSKLATDSAFAPLRNVLSAARADETVRRVTNNDYNGLDPYAEMGEMEYKSLLFASHALEALRRGLTKKIIIKEHDRGNDLGLNDVERIIVLGFCDMAQILDDISLKWREDVVWSDAGRAMHRLSENEKMELPNRLAQIGLNHAHAVLVPRDDISSDAEKLVRGDEGHNYQEIAYTKRYSDEYRKLAERIEQMITALGGINDGDLQTDRNKYINYLSRWKQYCQCTDIKMLDHWAEEMDRSWMDLPDTLLLTHPMEYTYYAQDGIRKDHAAFLGIADSRMQILMDRCNDQKNSVRDYLQTEAPKRGSFLVLLKSLETLDQRTRFLSLIQITRSMKYDARAAASSLPNSDHQEVTETCGKRIITYPQGCEIAWKTRMEAWRRIFGEESIHDFDGMSINEWILHFVVPHETGETASRNLSTDSRLGAYKRRFNEDKATTAGIARLGMLARTGSMTPEEASFHARMSMFSNIFFLSTFGSVQREPYYWHGVIDTNIARETGYLFFAIDRYGAQWVLDDNKASDYLIALENHFWEDQAPLWEAEEEKVRELGEKLRTGRARETDDVKMIIGSGREAEWEEALFAEDKKQEIADIAAIAAYYQRRIDHERKVAQFYAVLGLEAYQQMHEFEVKTYTSIVESLQGNRRHALDLFTQWEASNRKATGSINAQKRAERFANFIALINTGN